VFLELGTWEVDVGGRGGGVVFFGTWDLGG